MFSSNALPPPTPFGQEHRPLRLTSEAGRHTPQGGCHFQHSAEQQHKCLCQTYQHNRSAPGNLCDCGHSACYHSPTNSDGHLTPDRIVNALVEKVKKLEDLVIKERESHNDFIVRERQTREKEIWLLREALAPVYQSEAEMKKRLAFLTTKIDTVHTDIGHVREHMSSFDDIKLNLEQRLQDYEVTRTRKRKASIHQETVGVMSPESNYTASLSSSNMSDTTSTSSQKSPNPPSPINIPLLANGVQLSPRSSGLLNLSSDLHNHNKTYLNASRTPRQLLSPTNEPRSSGFLSINLTERMRNTHGNTVPAQDRTLPSLSNMHIHPTQATNSGLPSPPQYRATSGALPVAGLLSGDSIGTGAVCRSPKKRRQQGSIMTGLELLANVATPLAQRG